MSPPRRPRLAVSEHRPRATGDSLCVPGGRGTSRGAGWGRDVVAEPSGWTTLGTGTTGITGGAAGTRTSRRMQRGAGGASFLPDKRRFMRPRRVEAGNAVFVQLLQKWAARGVGSRVFKLYGFVSKRRAIDANRGKLL